MRNEGATTVYNGRHGRRLKVLGVKLKFLLLGGGGMRSERILICWTDPVQATFKNIPGLEEICCHPAKSLLGSFVPMPPTPWDRA